MIVLRGDYVNKKGGFSLVETMIGVLLLSIAVTVGIEAYLENQRFSQEVDDSSKAWYIAVQEVESLRRMQFSDIQRLERYYHGYRYTFKGVADDGSLLRGEDAITSVYPYNLLNYDGYKEEYFDPMGIKQGSVAVYLKRVPTTKGDKKWAYFVRVVVTIKTQSGNIIGGDKNLNGSVSSGDKTTNWRGSNVLDSPIVLETMVFPVI